MDIGSNTATMTVKLTLEGVDQARAGLADFGTKGEASVKRVQDAFAQSQSAAQSSARQSKLAYDSMHASMGDFARAGATASQIAQLVGTSMDRAKAAIREYSGTVAKGEFDTRGLKAAQEQMAIAGMRAGEVFTNTTRNVDRVTEAIKRMRQAAAQSGADAMANQLRALDPFQQQTATSAVAAGAGIGRLRESLTSAARSALALNPAVAQVTSVIGTMAIGAAPMVAILAGVAALGFAWNRLTKETREHRREQDEAVKSLKGFAREASAGFGGTLVTQLTLARERAAELRAEIEKLQAPVLGGAASSGGSAYGPAGLAALRDWLRGLGDGKTLGEQYAEQTTNIAIAQEELAKRFGQTTGAIALQVERQGALNAAFGKEQLALDLINNKFDEKNTILKNSIGLNDAERAALNALAAAQRRVADETAKLAESRRNQQYQRDLVEASAANAAFVRSARAQYELLGSQGVHAYRAIVTGIQSYDAATQRLRLTQDVENKTIAASVQLRKALIGATAESAARARDQHEATLRAIQNERMWQEAIIERTVAQERAERIARRQIEGPQERRQLVEDARGIATDVVARNIARAKALTDATVSAIKYGMEMRAIWGEGIGRIVTDGLKSFRDFFEDVLQMFSSMMALMEQKGKTGGMGYKLLGLGSAAIGGGFAGYQIGQSTGSSTTGALGGAAAGALAGSAFGLWGAAIGGLAGAAGGLLGAAKAQKEAADRLKESAAAFKVSVGGFVAAGSSGTVASQVEALWQAFNTLQKENYEQQKSGAISSAESARIQSDLTSSWQAQFDRIVSGFWNSIAEALNATRGPAGEFLNAVNAINEAWSERITNAKALAATEAQLADIDALRIAQIKQLILSTANLAAVTETLLSRHASITGAQRLDQDPFASIRTAIAQATSQGMTDLANALKTELALNETFSKYLDGLEAANRAVEYAAEQERMQTGILQAQLAVAQESRDAQLEIVNSTRQTFEALRTYRDSLSLSALSPLSPTARYQEAKRQYDAIAMLAAGGDKSALASLPGTSNTFLEESRNMFASSARYARDFAQVQTFVGALTDQYGAQLTTEEKVLAELQRQTATLEAQLGVGKSSLFQQEIIAMRAKLEFEQRMGGGQITARNLQWMELYGPAWKQMLGDVLAGASDPNNTNRQYGNTADPSGNNYGMTWDPSLNNGAGGWRPTNASSQGGGPSGGATLDDIVAELQRNTDEMIRLQQQSDLALRLIAAAGSA